MGCSTSTTSTTIESIDYNECSICLEEITNIMKLRICSHTFCKTCIIEWFMLCKMSNINPYCPLCKRIDYKWGSKPI